jgi:HEPN domain-containing protein
MTRSDQARLLQRKAAQDLAVLDRLLDDAAIDDETLGYHAQQAAEKLIKALLALNGHGLPAQPQHRSTPRSPRKPWHLHAGEL